MDGSRWMQECWSEIAGAPIDRVVMPATHDSGSFAATATPYVQCQDLDIGGQLAAGVRGFDLRVMRSNASPSGFTFHHNGRAPDPVLQDVGRALRQIRDHVSAHRQEMVVLWFSQQGLDVGRDLTRALREYVVQLLGPWVVPTDLAGFTLAEIHAEGRNVLLCQDASINGERPTWWSPSTFSSTYEDWQGMTLANFIAVARLRKTLRDGLAVQHAPVPGGTPADGVHFTVAAANGVALAGAVRAFAEMVNPRVPAWFAEFCKDARLAPQVNQVQLDYPSPEVIAGLVGLNRARSGEPDRIGEHAPSGETVVSGAATRS